ANTLFDERAYELHLETRLPDGSYAIDKHWSPSETSPDSPAQSFFHSDGEPLFKANGSLTDEARASFRHESVDPTKDDSATNPVTRVTNDSKVVDVNRDTLYASMTGELPEGSPMKMEKKDGKTFLVAPNGKKTEITVSDPPLTKTEAIAYME